MSDSLREFQIHLRGGPQTATIVDVLVHEGDIYLVAQDAEAKPHVLKIRPSGLLLAPSDEAVVLLALHDEEVAAWQQQTQPSAVGNSSTS